MRQAPGAEACPHARTLICALAAADSGSSGRRVVRSVVYLGRHAGQGSALAGLGRRRRLDSPTSFAAVHGAGRRGGCLGPPHPSDEQSAAHGFRSPAGRRRGRHVHLRGGADVRPVQSRIRVPLFAARTLNVTGQYRVTLSLRKEHLRAVCGPRQEERGLKSVLKRRFAGQANTTSVYYQRRYSGKPTQIVRRRTTDLRTYSAAEVALQLPLVIGNRSADWAAKSLAVDAASGAHVLIVFDGGHRGHVFSSHGGLGFVPTTPYAQPAFVDHDDSNLLWQDGRFVDIQVTKSACRSLQCALLMPQVNTGSPYRCARST